MLCPYASVPTRRGPKVDIVDAIELREYTLVRRMLEADPSLANAPDGSGGALRFATLKGDTRMVKLLLGFDADPMLPNEDVEAFHAHVRQSGFETTELQARFYGMKEFELLDPSGHVLVFGQETDEQPSASK